MSVEKVGNSEIWYVWKIDCMVDDESRLLTPNGPDDTPFDLMFDSEEEAEQALKDWDVEQQAGDEQWVLCKMTLEECYTFVLNGE